MKRGEKVEMVPLERDDRGSIDDPQFSGLMPSLTHIVFYHTGHTDDDLSAVFFRSYEGARGWIEEKMLGMLKGGHLD